jgi:hypothetical protein
MMSRSAFVNVERFAPTLKALRRSRFRPRFQLSDRDRQYIDARGLKPFTGTRRIGKQK